MNEHILHDAMNHLDDDLLEAADRLRSRQKKPFPIFRAAGIAACICLLLGLGWQLSRQMDFAVMESIGDHFYSENCSPMETIASIGTTGGETYVLLTDYAWTEDGITGTVVKSWDTAIAMGSTVTVLLPTSGSIDGGNDEVLYAHSEKPESVPGGEGFNALRITFDQWEKTENGIVIYAVSLKGDHYDE